LLSDRDSTITVSTIYSAREEELAGLKFFINAVRNDEIQNLTLEGDSYVKDGFIAGGVMGTIIGFTIGSTYEKQGQMFEGAPSLLGLLLGGSIGAILSGGFGYLLSTDDVILNEIPPGYDMSILKPLARYPDEEPEYLREIK
jgi:hypothetical protein